MTAATIKLRQTKRGKFSFACSCGTYCGGIDTETDVNAAVEDHIAASHYGQNVSVVRGALVGAR